MKLIKSTYDNLTNPLKPFDFEQQDAAALSAEMVKIMKENYGLGLSGNQVGLDTQIFVMQLNLTHSKEIITVINPVILEVGKDHETMPEGCLSHPGIVLQIDRPTYIKAKYFDINKNECIIELYDLDARCFLHEYDHLCGIEFTSRVSRLKLQRAKKQLTKELKRMKAYG